MTRAADKAIEKAKQWGDVHFAHPEFSAGYELQARLDITYLYDLSVPIAEHRRPCFRSTS